MKKDYTVVGYAMSSAGMLEDVEAQMRADNPSWDDKKIEHEMDKLLKDATLYNKDNKKPKKAKTIDDSKKPKKVK